MKYVLLFCGTREQQQAWEDMSMMRQPGRGQASALVVATVQNLVHHDLGVPVGVGVDPGRLLFLHVDAAVTAVAGERLIAAAVVMRELRAGAVIGAPPGVVDEESAPVIQDRVVNRGWRIPVR